MRQSSENHRPFHTVIRRNAPCISMTRDAKGRITLTLPLGAPEDAQAQFMAGWAAGERWQAAGAQAEREQIEALAQAWAQRLQTPTPQIVWEAQPHRWGTCRWERNLMILHPALLALPSDICEEVLLHEIVHEHIHDHSPAFWQELTAWMPDWPRREGFLRGWARRERGRRKI